MRLSKLRRNPLCEECLTKGVYVAATHVHHKIEVKDDPSRKLDIDNLQSLCNSCHSSIHSYGRK